MKAGGLSPRRPSIALPYRAAVAKRLLPLDALLLAPFEEGITMVKCADCGYLGVRHIESQCLLAPSEEHRKTGEPTSREPDPKDVEYAQTHISKLAPGATIVDILPVCALGLANCRKECGAVGAQRISPISAKKFMQDKRECGRFRPWIPGLTPKEHMDMKALEEQQSWQREQAAKEAAHHRIELWILGGFVGVCTLISGLCSILAALLQHR